MDIEVVKQLALGVVPPGVLGIVLYFLLWRKKEWAQNWRRSALASLAMGLGFIPLGAIIYGVVQFPPKSADQWLVPVGVAFGLLGAVIAAGATRSAALLLRAPLLALFALVSAPWLGATLLRASSGPAPALEAIAIFVGFVIVSLTTIRANEKLHERLSGPLSLAITTLLLGAASQVLILAFSALKMGQAAGVFASILAAATLISFFRPRLSLRAGALDVPVLTSATAFFQGVMASSAPHALMYAALLALSPWLALLPDATPLRRLTGWKNAILRISLASLPLVIALAMGKAAMDASMSGE